MEQTERNPANIQRIVVVGSTSVILLIIIVVGIQSWFYAERNRETTKKTVGQVNWNLTDLRLEQMEKITTYRWIDPKKKIAAIPIEEAMDRVLAEVAESETPPQ